MTFWKELGIREKNLIFLLILLTGSYLCFQLIYKPSLSFNLQALGQMEKAQQDLEVVKIYSGEIQAVNHRPERTALNEKIPFRQAAMAEAQGLGLSITRIQPFDSGELTIWQNDLNVKSYYRWLLNLKVKYDYSPIKVNLSKNPSGNGVDAQTTFLNGAGNVQ